MKITDVVSTPVSFKDSHIAYCLVNDGVIGQIYTVKESALYMKELMQYSAYEIIVSDNVITSVLEEI